MTPDKIDRGNFPLISLCQRNEEFTMFLLVMGRGAHDLIGQNFFHISHMWLGMVNAYIQTTQPFNGVLETGLRCELVHQSTKKNLWWV
jgi:hypothetical protein